ncbi:ferritin [Ruminiclostridium sufflavum DSM 19573]|uniref:Ferritin n=1 Tax=Ruminiclostridium sufflavum DSM 19573 TaxID=1121337 RepID=A0A318XPG4_9FIRM|nr:ferritin [Ruminiclostridium sufflavum]PYG90201.1 ferritin [Ruminiclostridium sufflavum DSM 19573]
MLNSEITKLINEQINKELYSSYLYLDMAGYYSDKSLEGFENWFYIQAQEERDHAMLFRTYLLNNDEKVVLTAVAAPSSDYADFKEPLLATLEHEKTVTASINNIYAVAYKEKDFRTMQFLDWFVKEQGEEEKNSSDLISKFDLFGNDSKGLYMLNQELGARVYTAPSLIP